MPILIKFNYKLMSVTMLVDYYQGKPCSPLIINVRVLWIQVLSVPYHTYHFLNFRYLFDPSNALLSFWFLENIQFKHFFKMFNSNTWFKRFYCFSLVPEKKRKKFCHFICRLTLITACQLFIENARKNLTKVAWCIKRFPIF